MASRKGLQLSTKNEDSISKLPDCLIHHIFNFMSLPDVVQTCVLSKRWEHLWTSVESLGFKNLLRITNFENFVDSLIMHRKPLNVSTFRLKLPESCDENINVWIVYAINRGVKLLDLEFNYFVEEEYELPDLLFTSQTLKELCIGHIEGIIGFSRSISLKSLKKLHINYLELCTGDMQNMICGCPMIESLHIEMCKISCVGGRRLDICSQTMKYLKIEGGIVSGVWFRTPNLLSLHYELDFLDVVWFDDMPYLEFAVFVRRDGDDEDSDDIARIIKPVASTKTLKLSGSWVDRIPMALVFPTFKKLKSLTMEKSCMRNLEAVADIMQHTPNLEELAIKQVIADDGYYCMCDLCDPDEIPETIPKVPFTCGKLRTIDVKCCEDGICSSDMIKAFQQCFVLPPELKE